MVLQSLPAKDNVEVGGFGNLCDFAFYSLNRPLRAHAHRVSLSVGALNGKFKSGRHRRGRLRVQPVLKAREQYRESPY